MKKMIRTENLILFLATGGEVTDYILFIETWIYHCKMDSILFQLLHVHCYNEKWHRELLKEKDEKKKSAWLSLSLSIIT